MPHKQAEHNDLMQNRASLTRFAWLSIGAALATITSDCAFSDHRGSVIDAIESPSTWLQQAWLSSCSALQCASG
jgi:hypothetical protein